MSSFDDDEFRPAKTGPDYTIGLDLGQSKDYTALCILEQHGRYDEAIFHARHLQRYQLGTSYPAIVADVATICRREPLASNKPMLAIDGTGVGAAVVDLFRKERNLNARIVPVMITGGDKVNCEAGVYRVPKRDLVSVVQVALQMSRLKIAASLPDAAVLTAELQNFQVKITESANDTYGAWREGTHDDLVLALALSLWSGMRLQRALVWV